MFYSPGSRRVCSRKRGFDLLVCSIDIKYGAVQEQQHRIHLIFDLPDTELNACLIEAFKFYWIELLM